MSFFLYTLHCHWKERWKLSETCEIFRKRKHQPEWQQHNSQLSLYNQQCAVCWWTHSEGSICQTESPKQLTISTKCEHDNSATGILKCMFTVNSIIANIRTEVTKNNNAAEMLAWYDINGGWLPFMNCDGGRKWIYCFQPEMKWHFMDWYRTTAPQKKFQDSSHSRERDQKVFWGMNGVTLVKIMEKKEYHSIWR